MTRVTRKRMIAILSRIFTGPNINLFSVLGMCVMVLGGIVCFGARKIKTKISGRPADDGEILPLKLAGLAVAVVGLLITVYIS